MKDKTIKHFEFGLKDIIKTLKIRKETSIEDLEQGISGVIEDGKQINGDK